MTSIYDQAMVLPLAPKPGLVSVPPVRRGRGLAARERKGDGLILTSGLTTEAALSVALTWR
jgi:hypothetical protein